MFYTEDDDETIDDFYLVIGVICLVLSLIFY